MKLNQRTIEASRVTIIGLIVNICLFVFKFLAGFYGGSQAMIADSFHTLSDFATDIAVLLGVTLGSKPVDKSHDYGHGKIETMASNAVGIALLLVGVYIGWDGIHKILHIIQGQNFSSPGLIAFWAALVSIIVKDVLYRYTVKFGTKLNSQAMIANAWHHRTDALSSIGVMLGIGGAILLGKKWTILDPMAAVILSLFIIKTAIDIWMNSINELLEASLSEEVENNILTTIQAVSGVRNPHEIKTRRIGNNIAIDIHIEVDKSLSIMAAHDISTKVEEKMQEMFGRDTFVSVHVEPSQ